MITFREISAPALIAHRGASLDFPENTLPAFLGAMEAGADVVELDVRLSSDGVPVVLHDPDVARTTDGTGLVHEISLADLRRLDASDGRSAPTQIPTLREVLDLCSGRIGLEIEIKNERGEAAYDSPREAVAEAVVRLLHETGFESPVLVSSFNPGALARVRDLSPGLPTGLLTGDDTPAQQALGQVRGAHRYLLPDVAVIRGADRSFVQQAHDEGVLIGTWTVNDAGQVRELFDWGVDAVETDDPRRVATAGPGAAV